MAWVIGLVGLALHLWMVWPAFDSGRWRMAVDLSRGGVIWGAVSLAFLAYILRDNPALVPILVVGVMVHEYGHVLAYRLAGHPAPVFRLVPFGGVAMSRQPAQTQAEHAFVALMGPGFSLVLIIIGLLASHSLAAAGDRAGARYADICVFWVAAMNAFNLLPFYPLDGGRVLRAAAMTLGPSVARGATLAMGVAFVGFALAIGSILLTVLAGFGLLAAIAASRTKDPAAPMTLSAAALALAAYAVLIAAHGLAALPLVLGIAVHLGVFG